MNRRTATLGLCMLCALAASAFAAQGAGAVTKGTTAFTCEEVAAGTGEFTKAHCKSSDAGEGNYSHVAVKQGETTKVEITNEGVGSETNQHSTQTMKATISGVETELSATKVHGDGWMENKIDENGEHYVHGEADLTYTEVQVTKPAGKGCKVYGDEALTEEGVIHMNSLTFTSTGQGDSLKFTPIEASPFATFWIAGCEIAALNGKYPITGSFTGTADGATLGFTEAKTTETLKIKNAFTKAGIAGELTVKAPSDTCQLYTPLSLTTVETA